jgi:hypothetical protein
VEEQAQTQPEPVQLQEVERAPVLVLVLEPAREQPQWEKNLLPERARGLCCTPTPGPRKACRQRQISGWKRSALLHAYGCSVLRSMLSALSYLSPYAKAYTK